MRKVRVENRYDCIGRTKHISERFDDKISDAQHLNGDVEVIMLRYSQIKYALISVIEIRKQGPRSDDGVVTRPELPA